MKEGPNRLFLLFFSFYLFFGQEVIIEVFKEHIWQKYKSKIMDVSQEILFIAYPVHMETNKILYLSNGKQVKVSFVDEDEQAYEFISLITGKKKDTIPLLKIIKPRESDIVKIQRRQFLRINWAIDIAVHAINSEFPPFTTVTSNISAGGMSIIVNKQIHLKLGQEILCWLVLPRTNGTYHYLKIKCKERNRNLVYYNYTKSILTIKNKFGVEL